MDIQCLQKVTQAIEARAVADPSGVFLKKSVVTVLSPEVGVHHVGDVANPPLEPRQETRLAHGPPPFPYDHPCELHGPSRPPNATPWRICAQTNRGARRGMLCGTT